MPENRWIVQVRNPDTDQWNDHVVTPRFAFAIRQYGETSEPKRLLRNGRVIRMHSDTEQLDLLGEEEA